MDISNLITGAVGSTLASSMSNNLKIDQNKAKWLLGAAVPLMVAAVNYNAKNKGQEESINNALEQHSGGIFSNLAGVLSGGPTSDGSKIVNHIFGSNSDMVTNSLSNKSGLSSSQVSSFLAMLAPVVMGFLGQQKSGSGGAIGNILGGLLGGGSSNAGGGLLGSVLGSVLGGGSQKSSAMGGLGNIADLAGVFFGSKNAPAKQSSALDSLTGLFGL